MKPYIVLMLGAAAFSQTGEEVYKSACAACHDGGVQRVPPRDFLARLTREAVVRSLSSGLMAEQGKPLSRESREAVAAYVTKRTEADQARYLTGGACSAGTGTASATYPTWNRWGGDVENSRFQPLGTAGLDAASVPKLQLAWAVALPGEEAARSQPAVMGGRLFVGSNGGVVFALDARTGCRHWAFHADFGIRGGVVAMGGNVFFTDTRTGVYALDAATGKPVWKTRVGEHGTAISTGTPQWHDGVLYLGVSSGEEVFATNSKYPCCTFRGSIVALDAATGKLRWRTHTVGESKPTKKSSVGTQLHGPSGVGVWTTPTIDRKMGLLYASTGDNFSDPPTNLSDAVLALDLKTGRIVWSRQLTAGDAYNSSCSSETDRANCPESNGPDHDFGQPPILVTLPNGKRSLVIGQKSGMVHSLDPDNHGEIRWQKRVAQGSVLGGIQWGSASDGEKMYVAIGDYGFKGLGANGLIPDDKRGGGMAALRLTTGEIAWQAKPPVCGDRPRCSPAQPGAVTAIPGAVFSGSLDGRLRAYSTADGSVLWEFDTARDFETVNGVKTHGGSIDAHGPVVAGGFVYTNSGYGSWGTMPGNVLLAFRVEP